MRTHLVVALAAFAACLPAASAADSSLLALAPPGSEVLVGINLKQIRGSSLGEMLLAQAGPNNAQFKTFVEQAGFDPVRDVDEVLVAIPAKSGKPNGFVLVRGTFDAARFAKLAAGAGATATDYHGVQIYAKGGEQEGQAALALMDPSLLVAGDEVSVRAFVDRHGATGGLSEAVAAKASQMAAANDVWIVMHTSPATFAPPGAAPPQAAALLQSIEQAAIGLKLGSDIVLTADATTQTPESAQNLVAALGLVSGMAASAEKGSNPAAAFLQKLKLGAEGNTVKLSLAVPEAEAAAAIRDAIAKMTQPAPKPAADSKPGDANSEEEPPPGK
jgi:hypothetical protein